MFRPFQPEDINLFLSCGGQDYVKDKLKGFDAKALASLGESWSGFDGEQFLGAAGIAEQTDYRAIVWALFATDNRRHFVQIRSFIREVLERQKYRRFETYWDPSFKEAESFLYSLGFQREGGYMPFYLADGRGAVTFVKLR